MWKRITTDVTGVGGCIRRGRCNVRVIIFCRFTSSLAEQEHFKLNENDNNNERAAEIL